MSNQPQPSAAVPVGAPPVPPASPAAAPAPAPARAVEPAPAVAPASDAQVLADLAEADANIAALSKTTSAKEIASEILGAAEPIFIGLLGPALAAAGAGPLGPIVAAALKTAIDAAIAKLGHTPQPIPATPAIAAPAPAASAHYFDGSTYRKRA